MRLNRRRFSGHCPLFGVEIMFREFWRLAVPPSSGRKNEGKGMNTHSFGPIKQRYSLLLSPAKFGRFLCCYVNL
jgi:hypothetical protein